MKRVPDSSAAPVHQSADLLLSGAGAPVDVHHKSMPETHQDASICFAENPYQTNLVTFTHEVQCITMHATLKLNSGGHKSGTDTLVVYVDMWCSTPAWQIQVYARVSMSGSTSNSVSDCIAAIL